MKQLGVILSSDGNTATVSVQRMSACSGCHKANPGMETEGYSACHECSVFPVETEMTVRAHNEAGADAGDRVVVETASRTVLGYAAAVFLLPLILAVIGGILFSFFGEWTGWPYLGALTGFVGAFVFVKLVVDRYASEKTTYTIVKIIRKSGMSGKTGETG